MRIRNFRAKSFIWFSLIAVPAMAMIFLISGLTRGDTAMVQRTLLILAIIVLLGIIVLAITKKRPPEYELLVLAQQFQDHPSNPKPRAELAKAYRKIGDSDKAAKMYLSAATLVPFKIEYLLAAAGILVEAGRVDEALTISQGAVERVPTNPIAWLQVGQCLFQLGQFEGALDALERVLELGEKKVQALHLMAQVTRGMEDYSSAIEFLKMALSLNPHSTQLRKALKQEIKDLQDLLQE